MADDVALPAAAGQFGNLAPHLGGPGLAPSMQILFNDGLYDRVKQLAGVMARAEGFTPKHLLGKPEACFTVIMIALDAKLIPHFVARHTYQTPGGQIGFDGALVQSILEQSGRFIGAPQFEYVGDWSKVRGKFEKRTSQKGNEFIVPTWGAKEADGLGIIVRWRVVGEDAPRIWPGENDPFLLTQCFPLNSPLWATDPKTQIAYLAIRRFANIAAPGILGAAIPDPGELIDASEQAIDVTPRPEPRREDFVREDHQQETRNYYDVTDLDGEVHVFSDPHKAASALRVVLSDASRRDLEVLDEAWEHNMPTVGQFDHILSHELAGVYTDLRERVVETARRSAAAEAARQQTAARQEFARAGRNVDGFQLKPNDTPGRGTAVDPERKSDDADAADNQGAAATASGGSKGEAEARRTAAAEPQQRGPDSDDAGVAGVSGRPGISTSGGVAPAGGSGAEGESPSTAQQTSQPASSPPAAAESRPDGQGVMSPASSPARDGTLQSSQAAGLGSHGPAERPEHGQDDGVASSPARVEQSETNDERPSQHIPVPTDQRTGKPNLRTWAIALFLPKVRRQTDSADLAYLMGHNADSVEACRNGGLDDYDLHDFNATIDGAWRRCK